MRAQGRDGSAEKAPWSLLSWPCFVAVFSSSFVFLRDSLLPCVLSTRWFVAVCMRTRLFIAVCMRAR